MLQSLVLATLLALAAGCGLRTERDATHPALLELAAAMDRRLQVAGDVAWAKQASDISVRDAAREAAVLEPVAALAEKRGVDSAVARQFIEAQMAAFHQWQEDCLTRWRAGEPLPPGTAPDLTAELRPRMDLATRELIDAWAAWKSITGRTRFNEVESVQIRAHLKAAGCSEAVGRLACGVAVEAGRMWTP